jgi:hypothetical protein
MTKVNRHNQPLMTFKQLSDRAKQNADRWEPLLHDISKVGADIKEYASNAIDMIEVYDKPGGEKRKLIENFKNLKPDEKTRLKQDFMEDINTMKDSARSYQKKASDIRDSVLLYEKDIINDLEECIDIEGKYAKWMKEENKTVEAWEVKNGFKPGETEQLITRFQEKIAEFTARYAGATSGAIGLAGAAVTVGMAVFPPFGFIGCLIGMSATAAEAERLRKEMETFKGQLARVQKFNTVKIYFNTMTNTFKRMQAACENAAKALETIAGAWNDIANTLEKVYGDANKLDVLAGNINAERTFNSLTKRGAERIFNELITQCNDFAKFLYVKDLSALRIAA